MRGKVISSILSDLAFRHCVACSIRVDTHSDIHPTILTNHRKIDVLVFFCNSAQECKAYLAQFLARKTVQGTPCTPFQIASKL